MIDKEKLIKWLKTEIASGKLMNKRMRKIHRDGNKIAPEYKNKWNELSYWASGKWNVLNELLNEIYWGTFKKEAE